MEQIFKFLFFIEWNGSIFLRSGEFKGATFKFILEFPTQYPHLPGGSNNQKLSDQSFPEVIFQSLEENKLWHPFIDEFMGFVDLKPIKQKYLNIQKRFDYKKERKQVE